MSLAVPASRVKGQHVLTFRVDVVLTHRTALGNEPRTSRTLSEKRTTGPSSRLAI